MSSLSPRSFLLLTLSTLIVSLANNVHASPTPSRGEDSSPIEARHFLRPANISLFLAEDLVDPCTLPSITQPQSSAIKVTSKPASSPATTTAKSTSSPAKTTAQPTSSSAPTTAKSTSSPAKTTAQPTSSSAKTTAKPTSSSASTITTVKPTPTTSSKPPASPTTTPRFVVYDDTPASGFPKPEDIEGYNVYILAFFLSNAGAFDLAEMWASLSSSQRATMRENYNAVGVSTILVSAFGSTDVPTTAGVDPTAMAKKLAQFVMDSDLDGVDLDYEDFAAVQAGTAIQWLITLTTELRTLLGSSKIITQAPVAPWLGPGGPYLMLDQKIGDLIDWYNIQFYSQGPLYTTCESLITESGGIFPKTSVMEIIAAGVPQHKVVIGKPGQPSDVGVNLRRSLPERDNQTTTGSEYHHQVDRRQVNTNGFIPTSTLATCISEAKSMGWSAGVMTWEFPHANSTWIKTVRGSAFPV